MFREGSHNKLASRMLSKGTHFIYMFACLPSQTHPSSKNKGNHQGEEGGLVLV